MIDDGDPLLRVQESHPATPCQEWVIIDRLATGRRGRLARSQTTLAEIECLAYPMSRTGAMLETTTSDGQHVRWGRLLPSQTVGGRS